jgi:hypothetical protein
MSFWLAQTARDSIITQASAITTTSHHRMIDLLVRPSSI